MDTYETGSINNLSCLVEFREKRLDVDKVRSGVAVET